MIAKDKEIGNIQYFVFKKKYKLLVLRWEKEKKELWLHRYLNEFRQHICLFEVSALSV